MAHTALQAKFVDFSAMTKVNHYLAVSLDLQASFVIANKVIS